MSAPWKLNPLQLEQRAKVECVVTIENYHNPLPLIKHGSKFTHWSAGIRMTATVVRGRRYNNRRSWRGVVTDVKYEYDV